MAFIEQMGLRNIVVEAKEVNNWQDLQKIGPVSRPYVSGLPRDSR